jgi:hypothetical protein
MYLKPKCTKVNRSIPYNKAKKVNNIKGISNINTSVSSNIYIEKLETDEISSYFISQDVIQYSKKSEGIDFVNELEVSVAVTSETEDHSELVNKQESADDTIEVADIDHMDKSYEEVSTDIDSVNADSDIISAYITTDALNKIEDMAEEYNDGICKIENAMSYKNSISPPYNNMRGVDFKMSDDIIVQQVPVCNEPIQNCAECCAIFTNPTQRAAFGYQIQSATCECHDICVEDVRDICVKQRTKTQIIPCRMDGRAGCRGGFLPDGPPTIRSWRVLCAEECLNTSDCLGVLNEVEFEVVLDYSGTLVVVTPKDEFECRFNEFARFPSGVKYTNDQAGRNAFLNEISQIDGSCKVIIIESVTVRQVTESNDCELVIVYKVIDKLWKHENLLVSALKPYVGPGETINLTIKQEFGQGHKIGPCVGGPCLQP